MNTKGAAADIQITVNGGEGLRWHYLPTAIRPGGLRAAHGGGHGPREHAGAKQ